MKTPHFQFNTQLVLLFFTIFLFSCEKDDVSLPTVETYPLSELRETSGFGGGSVTDDGGGDIIERGLCWGESPDPTITDQHRSEGMGVGDFSTTITGLQPDKLYYVRAYASNSAGTAYGESMFLKTMSFSMMDVDGNVYPIVKIGSQMWMAENLRTLHYENWDNIAHISVPDDWRDLTTGAYNWYDGDNDTYGQYYGPLYNYYATIDPRGLCPDGWHIPSQEEWQTLIDFLGGESLAADKMKSARTEPLGPPSWSGYNVNATNESGFSGYPGGFCNAEGFFSGQGPSGYWWTSTPEDILIKGLWLSTNDTKAFLGRHHLNSGLSVRCVRDYPAVK